MIVPYRPKTFVKAKLKRRYIILHDISCQFHDRTDYYKDHRTGDINLIRTSNWFLNNESDINYHFFVEKVNTDYECLLGRPLSCVCGYNDIPDQINLKAFHICMMGSFLFDVPDNRYYDHLAYRVVAPLVQMFSIPISNIRTHADVSSNQIQCPGKFFNIQQLTSKINEMFVKT